MKDSTYVRKVPFFKKKQFLTVLIGIFFIALMVLSALYYGYDKDSTGKIDYQGLSFVQTDSGWLAYVNDQEKITIATNPDDLDVEFEKVDYYPVESLGKIYLSVNPYDQVQSAVQELERNGFLEQQTVVMACYEDNDACSELPLKTCEDATNFIGVIVLKQVNETSVSLENNCLTIEGKDLLKVVDKFIVDQYGEG